MLDIFNCYNLDLSLSFDTIFTLAVQIGIAFFITRFLEKRDNQKSFEKNSYYEEINEFKQLIKDLHTNIYNEKINRLHLNQMLNNLLSQHQLISDLFESSSIENLQNDFLKISYNDFYPLYVSLDEAKNQTIIAKNYYKYTDKARVEMDEYCNNLKFELTRLIINIQKS